VERERSEGRSACIEEGGYPEKRSEGGFERQAKKKGEYAWPVWKKPGLRKVKVDQVKG